MAVFSEELIAYAHEDHEYDMKQVLVKPDNPFADMFYDKAFYDLKKTCNVVLRSNGHLLGYFLDDCL